MYIVRERDTENETGRERESERDRQTSKTKKVREKVSKKIWVKSDNKSKTNHEQASRVLSKQDKFEWSGTEC